MNNTLWILIGVLATVVISMFGIVLIPSWQFEQMPPVEISSGDSTISYPQPLELHQAAGKQIYQAAGCIYCHSQQVRPEGFGADIDRGWGQRRSVPRDYVQQNPPLLGTMRTGPDLANIGFRQPDNEWHFLHLFDPQITSPGSTMPPHPFLFETTTVAPAENATGMFQLPKEYRNQPTWIIPSDRAVQLVDYLKSLQQQHSLEEVR